MISVLARLEFQDRMRLSSDPTRRFVHEGMVTKFSTGGIFRTQHRWGVLLTDCFILAKPSASVMNMFKGQGKVARAQVSKMFAIGRLEVEDVPDSEKHTNVFGLSVSVTHPNVPTPMKKSYFFSVSTPKDKQVWVTLLRECVLEHASIAAEARRVGRRSPSSNIQNVQQQSTQPQLEQVEKSTVGEVPVSEAEGAAEDSAETETIRAQPCAETLSVVPETLESIDEKLEHDNVEVSSEAIMIEVVEASVGKPAESADSAEAVAVNLEESKEAVVAKVVSNGQSEEVETSKKTAEDKGPSVAVHQDSAVTVDLVEPAQGTVRSEEVVVVTVVAKSVQNSPAPSTKIVVIEEAAPESSETVVVLTEHSSKVEKDVKDLPTAEASTPARNVDTAADSSASKSSSIDDTPSYDDVHEGTGSGPSPLELALSPRRPTRIFAPGSFSPRPGGDSPSRYTLDQLPDVREPEVKESAKIVRQSEPGPSLLAKVSQLEASAQTFAPSPAAAVSSARGSVRSLAAAFEAAASPSLKPVTPFVNPAVPIRTTSVPSSSFSFARHTSSSNAPAVFPTLKPLPTRISGSSTVNESPLVSPVTSGASTPFNRTSSPAPINPMIREVLERSVEFVPNRLSGGSTAPGSPAHSDSAASRPISQTSTLVSPFPAPTGPISPVFAATTSSPQSPPKASVAARAALFGPTTAFAPVKRLPSAETPSLSVKDLIARNEIEQRKVSGVKANEAEALVKSLPALQLKKSGLELSEMRPTNNVVTVMQSLVAVPKIPEGPPEKRAPVVENDVTLADKGDAVAEQNDESVSPPTMDRRSSSAGATVADGEDEEMPITEAVLSTDEQDHGVTVRSIEPVAAPPQAKRQPSALAQFFSKWSSSSGKIEIRRDGGSEVTKRVHEAPMADEHTDSESYDVVVENLVIEESVEEHTGSEGTDNVVDDMTTGAPNAVQSVASTEEIFTAHDEFTMEMDPSIGGMPTEALVELADSCKDADVPSDSHGIAGAESVAEVTSGADTVKEELPSKLQTGQNGKVRWSKCSITQLC
ncbi:hypothetical protein BJ742DRAFT_366056 [Cladochytrium replicatum]|nr:hypothetical protein BJ742DRAFT_366056 [Cladochytrium replicatum]